jgi:type IV pilus assembly protein PilV
MLKITRRVSRPQHGTTMLEVLITIVILAFGLLGLAGLQSKIQLAEMESYQRAQAVLLLSDMVERINRNRAAASSYVSGTAAPLGVGDTQPTLCTALATGTGRDQCEWSNALKGAAEAKASQNVGAMIGARGCVEQLQVANPASGVCTPGVYRVTVTWQGLNATVAPALACGSGLYGGGTLQRAIAANITIGLPRC